MTLLSNHDIMNCREWGPHSLLGEVLQSSKLFHSRAVGHPAHPPRFQLSAINVA